ncbi:hypothetical protein [Conexibacter arvalis]|uniref:Uncharacterized protein n=1 Tax=Conexibacter arvalis TaxID=912552 RepID=A0A840IKD0_9ACTN|nr:hypothetical protein [Conexibacter arvalis]MBB4664691.1 hypothetical protein [Conexibacter arvalis]
MSDLIELLRAHDPERDGTEAPPVAPLLARIEQEPARRGASGAPAGPPRRTGPARAARGLFALGLAAAAVAVLVLLLAGGGRDEQALVPADGGPRAIVHVRYRTVMSQPNGRALGAVMQGVGTMDGPVEQWSTERPRRWRRYERFLPDRQQRLPGGSMEQAYADGFMRTRYAGNRRDLRRRLEPGAHPRRRHTAANTLRDGTLDPRGAVREMVARGYARPDGETVRDGRRLLRYVHQSEGRDLGRRGSMSGVHVTYLLDPETYRPVEIVSEATPVPGRRTFGGLTHRTIYEVYETLAPTPENLRLLRFRGPTR